MSKYKITKKLSLYFAVALLIFAVIIGSVFMLLFRNYSLDLNRQELEIRANNIAKTIPDHLGNRQSGIKGFAMYLNVINKIEDSDVWIVDKDLNLITGGGGQALNHQAFEYKDLPPNADVLIGKVLLGETVFSEDFTSLLDAQTLTVGVPIVSLNNQISGAVLLHSPIVGVSAAISQGILILVLSILLALIVAILLSVFLSRLFTKPLVKMNQSALKLIENDYSVKTNIKQNDEIGQLAQTLDILAQRLDKASQESIKLEAMRRDFIANISHELKTPVTVMRGSLEALVDEVVKDPKLVDQYHQQMLNEAKFLERLVQDLLELSKLQSLDFEIKKTPLSLRTVIEDVVRSANNLAKQKTVTLKIDLIVDDVKLFGDYERIRQMIFIILDNAIKFSKENSLVTITLDKNYLAIKDQGIGISKAQLPYIFERFYRSRSETNKSGTGLGLSIAKNIAQRHKIDLLVESEKAVGSIFIFKW